MSKNNQNNNSQVEEIGEPNSINTTTINRDPMIDFSSPIYNNPDYGNISHKTFVVYDSNDDNTSK
jgi:hypothetical protein